MEDMLTRQASPPAPANWQGPDRRRYERVDMRGALVRFVAPRGTREAVLLDVSAGGAAVQLRDGPAQGTPVTLCLPDGTLLDGEVGRQERDRVVVEFTETATMIEAARMLERMAG
jgi:hypothetical protein